MKKAFLVCVCSFAILSASAQTGAAQASLSTGKLDAAKEQIDKAVANPKQNTKAATWIYRGDIYASIANSPVPAYSALDSNATQVAYDSYKKAIELDPKKAEEVNKKITDLQPTVLNAGIKKYQDKNMEAAAKYFSMAHQLNPKDTVAALYTGIAYQGSGNFAKAREAFEDLIALGTNDASIYNVVYSIYRSDKNNEKALEIIKKGVAKFPGNKELKQNEFSLYLDMGKTEEAKNNLLEAVKAEPNNVENLKNLGILYDTGGDKEKAKEYYEKALALDPNNYDANFNMGVLYYNLGAELNQKVNKMDLNTYNKQGAKVEGDMKAAFQKALGYFEKNYSAKQTDRGVLEPMKIIYEILKRKADADRIEKVLATLPQ